MTTTQRNETTLREKRRKEAGTEAAVNEERRKDLVKIVKKKGEDGKIAVRNVRHKVHDDLRAQLKEHEITEDDSGGALDPFGGDEEGGSGDSLYDQAVALVCREKKASTSFVQRHLQIGYNRAARLIERMEAEGVVSTANHVGKREVLARNIE